MSGTDVAALATKSITHQLRHDHAARPALRVMRSHERTTSDSSGAPVVRARIAEYPSRKGSSMRRSRWGLLGYFSAGAFVVASVTYGATALEILGPTEPSEAGPLETRLSAHLAYQRDGFGYEQFANWTFLAALLSLGLLVVACHAAGVFRDGVSAVVALTLAVMGTAFAAAAQVIYLGAMERLLYSSQFQEVDVVSLTVGSDAVSRVDDLLESLGYILIGLALVLLVGQFSASGGESGVDLGLRVLTGVFAIGTFAAAATSLARSDAHDWVLLAVGLLIAPAWTAWVGALVGRRAGAQPLT